MNINSALARSHAIALREFQKNGVTISKEAHELLFKGPLSSLKVDENAPDHRIVVYPFGTPGVAVVPTPSI
ncbi:MAG: hypothetical protein EOP84_21655 [Verrucomicrobiaceae bacterium]|nr:MAG: hypothetical protein EOP84_21655 [Verrucomicrobiaceae bacterium]